MEFMSQRNCKMLNKHIKQLLQKVDIVIHIVDARFYEKTFSSSFVEIVKKTGKGLIIVVNKVDLISMQESKVVKDYFKDYDVVLFSAKKRWGSRILKEKIYALADSLHLEYPINVGLVGYPNVGKSSLISLLKGRTAAKISSSAGFTRGLQRVRLNKKIYLWDSPGVYLDSNDETFLALIGSINPERIKDKTYAAEVLLDRYGVSLEDFALKRNMLKRKGIPDENRAAIEVLRLWAKGMLDKEIERLFSDS